jgi:hypothetical protein
MRAAQTAVERLGQDLVTLAVRLGGVLLCPALTLPQLSNDPDNAATHRMRVAVLRLEREFATLTRDPNKFERSLLELGRLIVAFGPALVDWVDFIETLAQEATRQYGTEGGRGAFKRAQIQAVILQLARQSQNGLGSSALFLEPFIVDIWAGSTADFIVSLLNRYQLWDPAAPVRPARGRRAVIATVQPAQQILNRLSRWLQSAAWWIVLRLNPLTPRMQQELDRANPDLRRAIAAVPDLLLWLQQNKSELQATVQIAATAVNEAEAAGLLSMTGEQKQEYARDLILAFLDDAGFADLDVGLVRAIASATIDVVIDCIVGLFNKRGVLRHHRTRVPPRLAHQTSPSRT